MPKFITSLFCMCILAVNLSAQQPASITLEEAIGIALENNVNIKRSQNAIERQKVGVFQSRAEFLPNLSSSINSGRTIGRQFDQATVSFDDFAADRMSGSLSTGITLFSGWRNINNLRASRSSLSATEDDYERTRETVMFNTAAQFLNIILDEELVGVAEDNLQNSRRQLEQVEAQVEVGMRPIVDLYNQEATVASNELAVIQRENALNLSKVNLIGILQIDPFADYEFVSPGIEGMELEPKNYVLAELVEQAMANRRDVRATETSIQTQRFALDAAKGAHYPTVTLGASLSSNYNSLQQFGFSDQFFESNINRGLSVNIQIPLFNRFSTRTSIQQSEIDYKNALLDLENIRVEIFQEIRQAYNDYSTIVQEIETTETLERAAEKAFETEQERYNVGSSTLIELNDANNRYISAVSERIQAQYRFVFQEKILDFYRGQISPENIGTIAN
ncbi:MAG: TolC family protein [Balneolales bacterium]